MSETRQAQKINIGFKPLGVDPAHDIVYSVLKSLPRGGARDLIVQAVIEFLQNHAGETVSVSGKRSYIFVGDYSSYNIPTTEKTGKPKNEDSEPPIVVQHKPEPSETSESAAQEDVSAPPSEPAEDNHPEPENFTELDEDTLKSLVFGFFTNE